MNTVRIKSFSYKQGVFAGDGAVVYDCRRLPNPHTDMDLRHLTGQHPLVKRWLERHDRIGVEHMLYRAEQSASGGATVAFGCIGGRHRSVALTEMLAERIRTEYPKVKIDLQHLALNNQTKEG